MGVIRGDDMDIKLVDSETGEVLNILNEGDKILRAESIEYLTQTVDMKDHGPYVKVYTKTMFQVAKRLDGVTNQLLNLMISFISYDDGILQHSNGKPLTRQNIIDMSGLNEKTVDKAIKKLVDNKILGRHKTGKAIHYTANPFIFMKGRRISKTLYKFFEDSEWANM
jgi:predicted transcriptional regulator